MSDYQPGAVAVATVRGVPGVRVFRQEVNWWTTAPRVDGCRGHPDDKVTDVQPLVVLDLSRLGSNRLVRLLRKAANECLVAASRSLALEVADQIEAQTKPPKPPEPSGHAATVEASCQCSASKPKVFVRDESAWAPHKPWQARCGSHEWDVLDVVRTLSEGVES